MTKEKLSLIIDTLISVNNQEFLCNEKDNHVSLGYSIIEKNSTFDIIFYVFLFEESEEPQINDKLTINKEDKFDIIVTKITSYIINRFNEYHGYETEQDYNYINR